MGCPRGGARDGKSESLLFRRHSVVFATGRYWTKGQCPRPSRSPPALRREGPPPCRMTRLQTVTNDYMPDISAAANNCITRLTNVLHGDARPGSTAAPWLVRPRPTCALRETWIRACNAPMTARSAAKPPSLS